MSEDSTTSPEGWSPADNPYAIAVSEAQWWQTAVTLTVSRIRGEAGRIGFISSQQIDARFLILGLSQVLVAEQLEQTALEALQIDQAVRDALAEERDRFERTLPGVRHMRDALTHFDAWSQGKGFGPQRDRRDAGEQLRDIARSHWSFAYNPRADTISLGPYTIGVGAADQAARQLKEAIYTAAREVDRRNTAELRQRVVRTLETNGLSWGAPEDAITVSSGVDMQIWMSIRTIGQPDGHDRQELCDRVVAALAGAGLRLSISVQPQHPNAAEALATGEVLKVRPIQD